MLLIEQLKQIPDHRHTKGKKYSLWVILLLSLMGSLCGYIGYRPLADFAQLHNLITVKQNQPTLYRSIESTTQTQIPVSQASLLDLTHGRTVQRSVTVFDAPAQLLPKWIGLKSVIMVHRTGTRDRTFGLFLKLYVCGLTKSNPFFLSLYETTLPLGKGRGKIAGVAIGGTAIGSIALHN